jgi:dolichol-phosphate mannosyltransferase
MNQPEQTQQTKEMTVLIPVWNERECILDVLREFEGPPGAHQIRLLVIDDGSTDGTGPVLDDYSRAHPWMEALHVPHGGKDRALWAGFQTVRTDWTGMMDGDGQYDPKDFSRLLAHAGEARADAVWGIRRQRQDHALRFLSSWIGRTTKRLILGRPKAQDAGCGIWIARSRYLQIIPGVCPDPAGQVHCHIPELIATQGGRVAELEIAHRSRHAGQAKFGALNRIVPGLTSLFQAAKCRRKLTELPG